MKHYIKEGKDNISWLGSNFKEHFGEMKVKKEKAIQIETRTLPSYMNDKEILAECRPEEVSLGYFIDALQKLDKAHWYIFYIRDAENTLWAVSADWYDRGWDVEAVSVSRPGGWGDGDRVVSRLFSQHPQPMALGDLESQTLSRDEALKLIAEMEELIGKYKEKWV